MAEVDISQYKGNSNRPSDPPKEPRQAPPQIATPIHVSKGSSWGRLRRMIFGGDAREIGTEVLAEVIIPSIKRTLFEMISETASKSLFDDSTVSYSRGRHTSYDRVRRQPGVRRYEAPKEQPRPKMDFRSRSSHDFSGIAFATYEEAEKVADYLVGLIESEYEQATVSDFYHVVGLTSDFTDVNYGWRRGARIAIKVHPRGYILDLPRPVPLENTEY